MVGLGVAELVFLVIELAVLFAIVYAAVRLALRHDRMRNGGQ